MQRLIIQGDVVLTKIAEIPKDAKRIPLSKWSDLVIEHGESGNVHVLVPKGGCFADLKSDLREQLDTPSLFEMAFSHIELYDKDGIMYVRAKENIELQHAGVGDNHNTQVIGAGEYVKEKQREKDWFAQEVRPVQD